MTAPRPLDRNELGTDRPDELDAALAAASWLDTAIESPPVSPSAGFGDRVMSALAGEPAPALVGFMEPVRRRGLLAGFATSLRQAWTSIGEGTRPPLARASALAYVLAVAIAGTSVAGVATVGVAGALGMLGPTATQSAAPPTPGPITSPDSSPAPESPRPTDLVTVAPSESPEASDDEGGGPGASDDRGSGSEPSDDHGDNGPEASGDHGDNEVDPTDDHSEDGVEPSDGHDSSGSHDSSLGSN